MDISIWLRRAFYSFHDSPNHLSRYFAKWKSSHDRTLVPGSAVQNQIDEQIKSNDTKYKYCSP
jgi:hypothetical protein